MKMAFQIAVCNIEAKVEGDLTIMIIIFIEPKTKILVSWLSPAQLTDFEMLAW